VLLVQHGDSGSSTEHAGTTRFGRKEFATIPDFIRAGDVLVVTPDRPPGPLDQRPARRHADPQGEGCPPGASA